MASKQQNGHLTDIYLKFRNYDLLKICVVDPKVLSIRHQHLFNRRTGFNSEFCSGIDPEITCVFL